jgi:signal transduction histidine kinase
VKYRDRPPTPSKIPAFRRWFRLFGEARTSILLWYMILLGFFVGVSIPLMQQFVFVEVDARVREDLQEDMEVFRELLENDLETRKQLGLIGKGAQDFVAPPTTRTELTHFLDAYMYRRVPEDDTFLIAFVGDQLHRSSPRALPPSLQRDLPLLKRWTRLMVSTEGEEQSSTPNGGDILYIVEPILSDKGEKLGTFVAAHVTAGERAEALQTLNVVFQVMMAVLAVALLLAWMIAGRVLAPLRLLSNTAYAISESDLSQRIPVQGRGELAELATTFNDMMNRLEAAFATQRNFVNDAGHELRTPITIIRGHLELMDDDPQEQQETIALVMDELDRMSRFVEDLILLAKAERPDFLQLETIDLEEFTKELFAKATALGERDWQLDAIARGCMVGDRQRITQAVMNLAQNATQHTMKADTIGIGLVLGQRHVRFWVRDTGEGIATEDQERIFERFARAANSRRRSEGAGLGLSIVRAIAEAHSGRVYLRSQVGTGSTFTLVLPLEPSRETGLYESNSDR